MPFDFARAHSDYLDPDRHLNEEEDAPEGSETCRRCRGCGEVPGAVDYDTCPRCDGNGWVIPDPVADEPSELPDVGTSVPEYPTLTNREWENHLIDMSDTAAEGEAW